MAKAAKTKEDTFVPDVPAQMEELQSVQIVEDKVEVVEVIEKAESSEILFLKKILEIQHNGGWGKHLDGVINERINELKGK